MEPAKAVKEYKEELSAAQEQNERSKRKSKLIFGMYLFWK
jgi:hypothetical protein